MYVDWGCVAALGNALSTNILRRYVATWYKTLTKPRVTAAMRALPVAYIQKALRAYLWT